MIIKNLLIFSLMTVFSACLGQNTDNDELYGLYKSVHKNSLINNYLLNKRYEANVSIEIYQDSTFVKKSCYGILKGKWLVNSDSLVLNVKNIEVLFTGEKREVDYTLQYLIKKNKLINKEYDRKNKINLIEYLVKQ